MNRFYSWPIRAHLTILIALLAVPSISLIVYSGIAERREAIAGAKTECLKFVNDVAGQQQAMIAGAEQLATALSLLPPIQSRNPAAANALLAELLKKNPQYANISTSDKSGLIWASALPIEGKVSLADRRFFQEAVRTGMFSSGEYVVGRALKKGIMSFGYPVKNTANELTAMIGITLDLDYAQQMFEKLNLPPGSSFSLLDHQGTILIRDLNDPFSKKLIGGRDVREELFTRMTEGSDEGTWEAMGNDGTFRISAYKRISLPHESKPYLYVRDSIPLATAVSKANAAMFRNLSAFVSLFLVGLLLAWFIGKRLIVRPAMMLKEAAEQLAAGTDTVNVSSVVKGGELGEVARAFDGMAATLVQRETALRESEERWATTLASIGDAVIATDVEGKMAFMNAIAEGLTGWTLRDASRKPVTEVFHIINEQTRGEVENPVTKVLREGMVVGLANHTILVRKDGTEVPIDDSGAPIRDRDGKTMGVVLVFRDITERKRMEERTEHLASYPQLNPNPVIEVDIFGTITFSNPSSEAMLQKLGLDKKDLKILLPHDLDAILRDWDKKNESTFYREVLLADRVLGETVHLVPQFKVARVYALDITERKQADEALLQAKEAWERTFASVPDLIAIIDNQYRILRVNEAMARRLGIKPEEAIGLICYEAVHGLSEPPDYCPHSRTIKDGRQHIEEVHEDRLGGDFMVSTTPLHDDKGQMIGTVHVAHDITERKQAEGALRESEKRMGRAQEIAHLGSWELDVVNNRLSWSDEIYRIFGVQPQEFGATYDAFLEAVHPDDRAAVDAAYAGSLRERRDSYEIEDRVVRKSDGEVRFVHEKCEHVRDGAGRIIRSVGMVHDVTERKKAEDALQKAHNELEQRVKERTAELTRAYEKLETEMAERTRVEEQLRQSQKMEAVGTLAGGIAHDFNNMLAAIIGNAELAMDDVPEEMTARHNLDQIFKAGMRARGLVRQILTFSRKAEHERKPIALAPLVNETFKLLRASLPTTIEMRLNIDTVSDVVLADPVQIQQVLMNLCTNAGDAMRDTGGRLEVSLADTVLGGPLPEEGMQPGTYVTLTVSDTGHGMDEDVKSRIFEPFFTTKERGQGTGMGLAVVYGIVQSHQGVITVMSQPEQGATFTVYLPRHTSGEKADEPTSRPVPKGRERILFVDDEEMLVEMAEGMLGHLGYRVTGTTDSMSALQTFAQDPGAFDLVLTDHTMPQMTGAVLAQKLKEIRPDIPVILCTGYSETISKEKAESMGIDGFVMKPLSRNELGEVVRRVLDKKAKD